jgi:hypothetical protein
MGNTPRGSVFFLPRLLGIRGDVAFRMHSKFRRHHKGARFRAQSGTMVFRPTLEARQFVELWKRASEEAPYGEIDQSSQLVAMAESIGTTFVPLPLIYCVKPGREGQGAGRCRAARLSSRELPQSVGVAALRAPDDGQAGGMIGGGALQHRHALRANVRNRRDICCALATS